MSPTYHRRAMSVPLTCPRNCAAASIPLCLATAVAPDFRRIDSPRGTSASSQRRSIHRRHPDLESGQIFASRTRALRIKDVLFRSSV